MKEKVKRKETHEHQLKKSVESDINCRPMSGDRKRARVNNQPEEEPSFDAQIIAR